MPHDWDELSPEPKPISPEDAAWVRETLARIALGGREEEVAAWRAEAAERERVRLESLQKTARAIEAGRFERFAR